VSNPRKILQKARNTPTNKPGCATQPDRRQPEHANAMFGRGVDERSKLQWLADDIASMQKKLDEVGAGHLRRSHVPHKTTRQTVVNGPSTGLDCSSSPNTNRMKARGTLLTCCD
jgi:hypothetical protein